MNKPRRLLFLLVVLLSGEWAAGFARETWLSPVALAASHEFVYVACKDGNRVAGVDPFKGAVVFTIQLPASPGALALNSSASQLVVTCPGPQSRILLIDTASRRVTRTINAGHYATSPVLSPDGRQLFVCNQFTDDVSFFDLASGRETHRVPVTREPVAAALTADGKHLLVANHLPAGRADVADVAAGISVIEVASARVVKTIRLPNGSTSLQDIKLSPDGKYAVVSHVLARHQMPTTQLDRGWMNTNAKSVIRLDELQLLTTVLLDTIDRGAANPWGIVWVDDDTVAVALAGTHEICLVDFKKLLERFQALPTAAKAGELAKPAVPDDLAFLDGISRRLRLPADACGPRALTVAGGRLVSANYFSDSLTVFSLLEPAAPVAIRLGPPPVNTLARTGEFYFNDAGICFQGWQSCATCHPGEGRVDGLNWDLLNDGLGNPKNNKSLLHVHRTPPAMSTGVRDSAETAVRSGVRHILFTDQPQSVYDALNAYLKSLRPVPSPWLEKGKLPAAAKRGEKLFRGARAGCTQCHPPPLFTDLASYDVGTSAPHLGGAPQPLDTPGLVEVWRTAPYLHDGSAADLRDVFTRRNPNNQHGATDWMSPGELDDLIAYLKSL